MFLEESAFIACYFCIKNQWHLTEKNKKFTFLLSKDLSKFVYVSDIYDINQLENVHAFMVGVCFRVKR